MRAKPARNWVLNSGAANFAAGGAGELQGGEFCGGERANCRAANLAARERLANLGVAIRGRF